MRRKKFDDKKLDKKIIFEDKKLFVYFWSVTVPYIGT